MDTLFEGSTYKESDGLILKASYQAFIFWQGSIHTPFTQSMGVGLGPTQYFFRSYIVSPYSCESQKETLLRSKTILYWER
jgi:hypothetical protein